MKKIIFYCLIILCLFLIYSHFNYKKINYMSIGDNQNMNESYNKYVYEYLKMNEKLFTFNDYFASKTINDLINNIKNNQTIRIDFKDYFFKKELRESDFLVINIGEYELYNCFSQQNMIFNEELMNNIFYELQNLINEITLYAKGKILFLGLYNPINYYDSRIDSFFFQTNNLLQQLMQENNIIYIDLYELIKSNDYKNDNNYKLNDQGLNAVAEIIKTYIN